MEGHNPSISWLFPKNRTILNPEEDNLNGQKLTIQTTHTVIWDHPLGVCKVESGSQSTACHIIRTEVYLSGRNLKLYSCGMLC